MWCKIFLSLLLFSWMFCFSQSKPHGPIVPSPNAASLGIYGEIPVSLYTGLPSIEVPVYTIQERGFEFPITMSYHAQGFRPESHPSWVGSNWSLRFGGVITRKLHGFPDEWKSDAHYYYGYYHLPNRLNNINWSSNDTILNMKDPGLQTRLDREPDVFEFSIPGASGRFFLDHTGKWRVQCDKNIKVIFNNTDLINPYFNNDLSANWSPKVFSKFTILDDHGVKYIFGSSTASTAAIEYSSSITAPDFQYRVWLIASSWYLQKIELPGNIGYISIDYVRGPFQSNFQYQEGQNRYFIQPCNPGSTSASNYDVKGISGSIISPVYATRITTSSGIVVDFNTSKSNELTYPSSTYMEVLRDADNNIPSPGSIPPRYFSFLNAYYHAPYYAAARTFPNGINNTCFVWFKLDSLTVSTHDITNSSVKLPFQRVRFNYRENSSERLKLLSMDFRGNNTAGDPKTYSFNYTSFSTNAYLANLTDHWGFSNGILLQQSSAGWYYWLTGSVLMRRQPSFTWCSNETLLEIIYPTGGKTKFEYEVNKYGKCLIDSRQYASPLSGEAGGLRVKRILNIDPLGKTSSREYYYVYNYTNTATISSLPSSGVLDKIPRYNYSVNTGSGNLSIYSSNSIVPLSSNSGLFISYSEVVEKYQDGSYRVFNFTNHDNGYIDHSPVNNTTPYELGVPYRSTDFERGKPVFEKLYSSNNTLVQMTENTYMRINPAADSNFSRALRKEFGGYCISLIVSNPDDSYKILSSVGFQVPEYCGTVINPLSFYPGYTTGTAYGHYAYKFVMEKTRTTIYPLNSADNIPLIRETIFQYDAWGNIIRTTDVDSKGAAIHKNIKYPHHFPGTAIYDSMVNRSMTGIPVETDRYNGTTFLESEKTEFDFFNSSILIKPKYIRKKTGTNPVYTIARFNIYDQNGNIREVESGDGIKTAYVWSHFNSKLVDMAVGVTDAAVQSLINPAIIANPWGEQQLSDEIDKVRNLSTAYVTTYLYDPNTGLNLKKIKDPNGKTLYYEYDHLGRLLVARDNDQKILKKYEYRYQQEFTYPYRNTVQSAVFQSTITCPPGYAAGGVLYTVPADKYGSFISIPDANAAAISEMNANGIANANALATCSPVYSFAPCCSWGSPFYNFSREGSSINFSFIIFRQGSPPMWANENQVANLTGLLFVPTTNRTISVTNSGRTWNVRFKTNGQVSIQLVSGSPPLSSVSLNFSGSYLY